MPVSPSVKSNQLSRELSEGIPDAGTFEDMPKIKQIAGESAGP